MTAIKAIYKEVMAINPLTALAIRMNFTRIVNKIPLPTNRVS